MLIEIKIVNHMIKLLLLMIVFLYSSITYAEDSDVDLDYGQYLSSECASCHSKQGSQHSIPYLNGQDPEHFIHALEEYKTGVRENSVMKSIALSLGTKEMKSLAAWFAKQPIH